jgi:hypothetical protein
VSIRTLPDGRQVCDTPGHQHQLLADAFHCAFQQTWKRLAEEARQEQAAAEAEGLEAASMEAVEIQPADQVRLAPGLWVKVTSVERREAEYGHTDGDFVEITCDEGTILILRPDTLRWVRYSEHQAA